MKIHIPTPLRSFTGGKETVTVAGTTVTEALQALVTAHPEMKNNLFSADGKLRSFVNLYLNDDDIRYLPSKEATAVHDADELTIIPSIAGGIDASDAGAASATTLPSRRFVAEMTIRPGAQAQAAEHGAAELQASTRMVQEGRFDSVDVWLDYSRAVVRLAAPDQAAAEAVLAQLPFAIHGVTENHLFEVHSIRGNSGPKGTQS